MKRRDFLKAGALSATLPFWMQYCRPVRAGYPITVHSDHQAGHLVIESQQWPVTKLNKTGTVIVGGGIAGLTAAHQLRNTDFKLFELSDRIGGTASAQPFENIHFCQGAHYELAYPDYYGEEVLTLLESLDIIRYESWKKTWTFADQQHIIPYHRREQCLENGQLRKEVMKAGPLKDQFTQLLQPFHGHMTLPTRLIEDRFHHLNELTFHDYLGQHMTLDPAFKRQVDYHMLDDYGGTSEQVSALAGIHYFRCRPYYEQSVDLFSPPNGNDYFAQKLSARLPSGSIHLDHLVASINYQNGSYQLQILDINNRRLLQLEAEQVIYTGQKHALRFICPDQASLFSAPQAPWMVVNLIIKQTPETYGFWQNEYLGTNPSFLGFIDSSVQHRDDLSGYRIFSGYYCLREEDRDHLVVIHDKKNEIAEETRGYVEDMLGTSISVETAYINVMGHAMPIPVPHYLLNDANADPRASMIYAGVDNGRLPLLFEALDSGVQAAGVVGR